MLILVWAVIVVMVALTVRGVVLGVLQLRRVRAAAVSARELVDFIAREVRVGARSVDAVEQAVAQVTAHVPAQVTAHASQSLKRVAAAVRLGAGPLEAWEAEAQGGDVGLAEARMIGAGVAGRVPLDAKQHLGRLCELWQHNHDYGLSLADMGEVQVEDIDAQLAHLDTSQAAMSGARLTVTVLVALPVGAVGLGESMGLGTAHFLAMNPLGVALSLGGVMLMCAGAWWAEKLSAACVGHHRLGGVGRRAGPRNSRADPLETASRLDVAAAALRAGMPVAEAWLVAMGTSRTTFLLRLGAGPEAWAELAGDPLIGPVARQAAQQQRSGAGLAAGMTAQAIRLRKLAADEATAGAQKVLVVLAAPLTLCFLPAFVLVGLIPLALGLAGI